MSLGILSSGCIDWTRSAHWILALRRLATGQARGLFEDEEVRCSGVPRANTASLSGHGSAKLGEQELHLQISHRRTVTTVRSGAEWHEGQVRPGSARFGRAATMSLS
jgi:hypothetical protein